MLRKCLSRIIDEDEGEQYISKEHAEEARRKAHMGNLQDPLNFSLRDRTFSSGPPSPAQRVYFPAGQSPAETTTPTGPSYGFLSRPHTPIRPDALTSEPQTPLSTERIMDEKPNKQPQDLTPFFTDPTGLYYRTFERQLESLSGKTSENNLCIEEYLEKSEKQWFNRLHNVKMSNANTPAQSRAVTPAGSIYEGVDTQESMEQFLLPENYKPPTGLRRILSLKLGDWPIYSFLLALGQILAANSYQITLLTGQIGETANQLYVVASIYLGTTLIWWYLFRRLSALYVLTLPWFFYGLAFFLLAFSPYGKSISARGWVQHVATAMYAVASSSGAFFFSQNFGKT